MTTNDVEAGLTRRLATHVATIRNADLPDAVLVAARRAIADALACGLAGSRIATETVGPIRKSVAVPRQGANATSLLHSEHLDPISAALVNGTTIHTIDFDDTHMAVVSHFGAPVVAAALAATQASNGTPEDFVCGVVAGFEAGARIGRACMPQHYHRWHATSSLGGLAAAAAAARAMRLDPIQTEMAIGLAADDTGGTRVAIAQGDISKSLHAGVAAQKGVRSAVLVQAGARGPLGHLEHPYGFFWAYSEERDARRLPEYLEDMGTRFEILEDDIKAFPCILSSHTAIEAVISLARDHGITADDIDRIELTQPRYSDRHGMNQQPETAMAARLSVPYCVWVALEDGTVGMKQFEDDRWLGERLRARMQRVTLDTDEALRERYPGQAPTSTRIVTHDGATHEREIGIALGSHQRPLSDAALREKHDSLLSYCFSEHQRASWHELMSADMDSTWMSRLDTVLRQSVGELS